MTLPEIDQVDFFRVVIQPIICDIRMYISLTQKSFILGGCKHNIIGIGMSHHAR